MVTDVLISVNIKRIENHLSILQNELKETNIIIELLTNIYQMVENPNTILHQLQFMEMEKACIQRKIHVLENSIDKFSKLKININNGLNGAIEVLGVHEKI